MQTHARARARVSMHPMPAQILALVELSRLRHAYVGVPGVSGLSVEQRKVQDLLPPLLFQGGRFRGRCRCRTRHRGQRRLQTLLARRGERWAAMCADGAASVLPLFCSG